jgi:CRP-like cAMP-binding protein
MSLEQFVTRLTDLADLSPNEVNALRTLPFHKQQVAQYRDVIVKGERPSYMYVVLKGWAGRYNIRPDGTRRITGFLVPGDFCGIHAVCHAAMDHGITALTDCEIAKIELPAFEAAASTSPLINRALWQAKLVDEAILRTWLLNSTDSARTLAHLFCEVEARLHPADEANERTFAFPLTQEQIGDAIGITSVHTNRTLRVLRERGLATLSGAILCIPDLASLRREASFDARYLHLPQRSARS